MDFRLASVLIGLYLSSDLHPDRSKASGRRALSCLGHGLMVLKGPTLRQIWSDLLSIAFNFSLMYGLDDSSDPVGPFDRPVCHGKSQGSGLQYAGFSACVHRKCIKLMPSADLQCSASPRSAFVRSENGVSGGRASMIKRLVAPEIPKLDPGGLFFSIFVGVSVSSQQIGVSPELLLLGRASSAIGFLTLI